MLCWGNVEKYMKNIDNLGYFEKLFQSISNKKCMKLIVVNVQISGWFFIYIFFRGQLNCGGKVPPPLARSLYKDGWMDRLKNSTDEWMY